MTRVGETEADDLFRADARNLGYLDKGGRGLYAYYEERGMVPPGKEAEYHRTTLTGLDLDMPMYDEVDE